MNPRAIIAFVLLGGLVRLRPIALASHHNPARASVSPAGGSVAVSDSRKSSAVMEGTVQENVY